jgi:hypothetical protein
MRDLNEVIRTELQKDQEANPRQKLMMKRHQQVAEDNFKSNNRLINVKKRPGDEEEEKGMGLLHLNLDRQKIEREAKKQQYKYELGQQVAPVYLAQRKRRHQPERPPSRQNFAHAACDLFSQFAP